MISIEGKIHRESISRGNHPARGKRAGLAPEELLRQLVQQLGTNQENKPGDSERHTSPVVLCEINISGYQYTLTRSRNGGEEAALHLSPREQEIVRLVSKGLSNRAIAAVLDISRWTVSTHMRRIFNKLGVASRAEMVACVMKERLLDI